MLHMEGEIVVEKCVIISLEKFAPGDRKIQDLLRCSHKMHAYIMYSRIAMNSGATNQQLNPSAAALFESTNVRSGAATPTRMRSSAQAGVCTSLLCPFFVLVEGNSFIGEATQEFLEFSNLFPSS